MDVIEAPRGSGYVDDAAQIWAEATAARDGDAEVAGLKLSRPIIEAVPTGRPQAMLLIARTAAGDTAGFAAVEPEGGTSETTAEVRYFGVRPRMWGRGVGETLLRELPARLRAAGFSRAALSVYLDNTRAVTLYERLGWRPCGAATAHPRTGKPEQRYQLSL